MTDPNAAPAAGGADDDLGATLEANWDAQEASDSTDSPPSSETPDPSASPSAGEEPAASSPAAAGGDAARARDDLGRFTKAEKDAAAQNDFKIPDKWPANVKAQLETIYKANPEHAKFVLDQYAHFRGEATRWQQTKEREFQRLGTVQKQVEDLLAPGRQARALKGIDDTSYIRNLVAAGDFLDKNPVEGLKYLAKQYGVDLSNLPSQQGGGEPAIPPEVQRELQRVAQENAEIKAALRQQYVGMEQGRLQEASSWIDQFASQTDASGAPLYPYFDEVLNELCLNVQYQMQSGQPVDVHAAYDRAIRMNDSVWLRESQRRSETSRKEAEAKAKREAEEAKRAGYTLSGSGARSADAVPDDLGDHLARNYDKLIS